MSLTRYLFNGWGSNDPAQETYPQGADFPPLAKSGGGLRAWPGSDDFSLQSANSDLRGFQGSGVSYGDYLFLGGTYVSGSDTSGIQPRIDMNNFDVGGVTTIDTQTLQGNARGYGGLFSDGAYGYYVPLVIAGVGRHGQTARVPLDDFQIGSAEVINLQVGHSNLKGCRFGFYDAQTRYAYYVSNHNDSSYTGIIGRVPVDNFTTGAIEILDMSTVNSALVGVIDGFVVNRNAYFVTFRKGTSTNTANIIRLNLDDFSSTGLSFIDLATLDASYAPFLVGFTDGLYAYGVNQSSSLILRVPLANFDLDAVEVLRLSDYDSLLTLPRPAVVVGNQAYVVGFYNLSSGVANCLFQVDLQSFSIVSHIVTTDISASVKGSIALSTHGPHVIWIPYATGGSFGGNIARIAVGNDGGHYA